ncbi:MAG: septum formation initiator family protein [Candidatus Omnitrophica bacterium]|nr:septum formation initiator family protein [Candidatus Omnitrophota bacterium]
MKKRYIIFFWIVFLLFLSIYFPGFSRLQQLKEEKKDLAKQVEHLRLQNKLLKEQISKMETDPVYVEGVARENMKRTRKGEIVYKIQQEVKIKK